MAGSNLSGSTSRDAVADYLAAVTAQLTGPASARAAVTDELRDGLMEALETHHARDAHQAGDRGGDRRVRRPGHGRRRVRAGAWRGAGASGGGRGLLVTGPLVGLAWIAAVVVNALPPWRHQLIGPWLALPLVGLAWRSPVQRWA